MKLTPFVPSISEKIRQDINAELDRIESEHDVRILFAIESGSRAWGFPSPDSDYDVRFIYARRLDWYLTIFPGRDVIERPISDELDIGGWDIRKAIGLLLKPNPVMFEWLSSPIRYRWLEDECARLRAFSKKPAHSTACLYHYLNLGRQQFERNFSESHVVLKKYFYVLRPALAIHWMREHPELVPPMNIQELVNGLELDHGLVAIIDDLIRRKSGIRERGEIERIALLDQFIADEFEWAKQADKEKVINRFTEAGNQLFQQIVKADW